MRKIEPILAEQQTEFTGLISNIANKVNELVEAVNTINEVLSDKICGCGIPFKNHGTGRSGYCTDPSKPSEGEFNLDKEFPSLGKALRKAKRLADLEEEEIDWDKADKAQVRLTEAEIRADERSRLREKFDKVLNEASVCEEIKVMYSIFKDFIQELK